MLDSEKVYYKIMRQFLREMLSFPIHNSSLKIRKNLALKKMEILLNCYLLSFFLKVSHFGRNLVDWECVKMPMTLGVSIFTRLSLND